MKAFKEDRSQQEKIAAFFKEETTYFPDHVLGKAAACILVGISSILLIIPFAEYENDMRMVIVCGFMLYAMGMFLYGTKYESYTEPLTKKVFRISGLTKYLPVSRTQLTIFRIKKILNPCVIVTAVVVGIRCLYSVAVSGGVSVWDFVLPAAFMIGLPVIVELTRG